MSFRIKLLVAMMLVVGAVTGGTLLATQRKVQTAYEQMFDEQFRNQITYFSRIQEERLTVARARSLAFAKAVRVISGMSEYGLGDKTPERIDDIYQNLTSIFDAWRGRIG